MQSTGLAADEASPAPFLQNGNGHLSRWILAGRASRVLLCSEQPIQSYPAFLEPRERQEGKMEECRSEGEGGETMWVKKRMERLTVKEKWSRGRGGGHREVGRI